MKKQQPKRIKTKKGNKKWFWVAVVVLFAVLLGGVLHHHLQTSAQNKTFKDTQSWLRGVMDEVAAENPGSKRVSDPYCRRPSAKYVQTERSCFVSEFIVYPTKPTEVDKVAENMHSTFLSLTKDIQLKNLGTDNLTNRVRGYSFTKNNLECFVSYYRLNDESGFSFSQKMDLNDKITGLLVSANCSGPAMADYFPNRD